LEFKDYYQTLGVAREATADEIKKAFRRLARKYHPDVSKEKDAEARMKDVNEAYAVLSDPEKRAAYDQLGRDYRPGQEFRPPPNWDAGFEFSGREFGGGQGADFSDFFAELFGRSRAGGPAARPLDRPVPALGYRGRRFAGDCVVPDGRVPASFDHARTDDAECDLPAAVDLRKHGRLQAGSRGSVGAETGSLASCSLPGDWRRPRTTPAAAGRSRRCVCLR